MSWRNAIRQQREDQGLTQARLAEMAGMHASNVAAFESQSREPTVGSLLRLARALNVELSDLIEVKTEDESNG